MERAVAADGEGKVNVVYTPSAGGPKTVPQDASVACNAANGWQYSPDKKKIVLCGSTCDAVKADPGGSLSIQLGCGTVTVPK